MVLVLYFCTYLHVWLFYLLDYVFSFCYFYQQSSEFVAGALVVFLVLSFLQYGKDSDAERHCGQEEKGMTEDEMVGWHHRLDGREFE